MKVRECTLRQFKRFEDQRIDFCDEAGLPRNLVLLVGPNGSGKSTILQALAATLGTATRAIRRPSELRWPGFDLDLADASWRRPYDVSVEVSFLPSELDATGRYFGMVPDFRDNPEAVPPGTNTRVPLTLAGGQVHAPTAAEIFQFRGRQYARQVRRQTEEGASAFEQVGGVLWYHEHRSSFSLAQRLMMPRRSRLTRIS